MLGVTELMKRHNKTTMLYVADWVGMASLEQGGRDWHAVSKGFDPCVKDVRDSNFLQQVLDGEEKIAKIFLPMDEEFVPFFLDLLRSEFPNTPFKTTRALPYIIEIGWFFQNFSSRSDDFDPYMNISVAETVDKSGALAYFCEKYNISPSNVITFGDGENDVGMFRASGYSVSMANAMPLPKSVARSVCLFFTSLELYLHSSLSYATDSNNEGGVGVFLDRIFRPTRPDASFAVDHLKTLDAIFQPLDAASIDNESSIRI